MVLLVPLTFLALSAPFSSSNEESASCSGGCSCRPRLSVCIPTAPSKDMRVFDKSLVSVVRHLVDVESVWIVSRANSQVAATISKANAIGRLPVRWLDEDRHFPFNYSTVGEALGRRRGDKGAEYAYSVGWYVQQFIKLNCGRAIGGDVLVLDSDVVFFRPVAFVESARMGPTSCEATYRYAFSREQHVAYLATNAELLGFEHPAQPSGVVHHMVFRADVLAALEAIVESRFGKPLWATLLDYLGKATAGNLFSEYQLYFHFARMRFPDSVKLRQLYWANGPGPRSVVECATEGDRWPDAKIRRAEDDDDALRVDTAAGYDYVAYHSYAKRRNCVYAPHGADGVCFGPGCTHFCYKRRDEAKYKLLDRSLVAPRLCAGGSSHERP